MFRKRSLKRMHESRNKMQCENEFITKDMIQRFQDLSSRAENMEKQLPLSGKDKPEVKGS